MQFRVHGANRITGEEHNWIIECATSAEAEKRSIDAGMLVSRVERIGSEDPVSHNYKGSDVFDIFRKPAAIASVSTHSKKQCPSCKESINRAAIKCPYCQSNQPAGLLVILIALVISIVLVLAFFRSCDNFFSLDTSSPDIWQAEIQHPSRALSEAQDYVKALLTSPGSAKWPGWIEGSDHTTSLGNNRYRIRSWVDSQNGFGALLRTHYTAVVESDRGGNNWTLESLNMDE